eukprot:7045090-Prymnesium_polylepis.3
MPVGILDAVAVGRAQAAHRSSSGAGGALVDAVRQLVDTLDTFAGDPPADVLQSVAAALGLASPGPRCLQAILDTAEAEMQRSSGTTEAVRRAAAPHAQPGWRSALRICLLKVLRERRGAGARSAADLRAELEEERGEGKAASAFCTSASASHTLPAEGQQLGRALVLFSGPYKRDDSLAAHLRSRGFAVDTVDNDPAHGDADDDFLDDAFFDELQRKTLDGQYYTTNFLPLRRARRSLSADTSRRASHAGETAWAASGADSLQSTRAVAAARRPRQ